MPETAPLQIPEAHEQIIPDELTLDNFYERWGESCGYTKSTFRVMWDDAQSYYRSLPFHNFTHAREVLWASMELADQCAENGLDVNRKLIPPTSLFHDAEYHTDHKDRGSSTKEKLAARIFQEHAPKYGLSPGDVALGTQMITATHLDGKPITTEDKILVRADLQNIGGDYRNSFIKKTMLLREETKVIAGLQGKSFDESEFVKNSILTLSKYLRNDLSLGHFDNRWSKHAVVNLNRLIKYAAAQESIHVARYVHNLGSTAVTAIFDSSPFKQKDSEN